MAKNYGNTALETCESDGSVQLDSLSGGPGHTHSKLVQVCLFGHWSYVCGPYYDGGIPYKTSVALYQAGCSGGNLKIPSPLMPGNFHLFRPVPYIFNNQQNKVPAYLAGIVCSGLERKLIECHSLILENRTCINYNRLGVTCSSTSNA